MWIRHLCMLDREAIVDPGQRVEARIAMQRAVGGLNQRHLLEEQIAVVEPPGPQHELAVAGDVFERGGQLSALVGLVLRVAHSVGDAPEPADAGVPVVAHRESVKTVEALFVLGTVGKPYVAGRDRRARAQNEVGRRTDLSRTEYRTGTALHDLDAGNRVIQPEQRAGIHVRQLSGPVQGRAVDHDGGKRRAVSVGEAGNLGRAG